MSDLHSVYKDIINYLGYLGIPDVTSRFAWKKVKSGEGLFAANSKEPAVLTLVGRVSDDRFAVGPSGNYRTYGGIYPPFQPSKYTFSVKEPNQGDDPFTGDWEVGWENILKLQASISKLPLRRNLLESGEVRLSAPVLEKMVRLSVCAVVKMTLTQFSHRMCRILRLVTYTKMRIMVVPPPSSKKVRALGRSIFTFDSLLK